MHASLHYFLEKCPVYEKRLALEKKRSWNLNPFFHIEKDSQGCFLGQAFMPRPFLRKDQ